MFIDGFSLCLKTMTFVGNRPILTLSSITTNLSKSLTKTILQIILTYWPNIKNIKYKFSKFSKIKLFLLFYSVITIFQNNETLFNLSTAPYSSGIIMSDQKMSLLLAVVIIIENT